MMSVSNVLLSVALLVAPGLAAQTTTQDDEQAIRQSAAKYAEAFNRGDLDALVSQYALDADYDDGDGNVIKGRDAIRREIEQNLAGNPGAKMDIEIKSIRFMGNRAIEIGVATLTPREGSPTAFPYRAINVKQSDGLWLMTSVGPDVTAENATGVGPLEELSWLIGTWRDAGEDMNVESISRWSNNRRFIIRSFTARDKNGSGLDVSEVIGWDPADRVFRSWVFDSDGAFAQSTWRRHGDDWIISSKGTLADGGRASAVNIIHPINATTYTWSATNRDVDSEMLPDVNDVKMVRVTEAQRPTAEGRQP